MNFYQRMGILPLKKRVNHDKCSFATKQRMFGVFAIDEILRYRGTRFPSSRTLCHPARPFIFPIIKFITNHVLIPLNFPPRPGLNSPPPHTHTHSSMTPCLVPSAYDYLHYVYFSVVSIAWIWWSIQRSKYQWQRSSSWPGKGCPFLKCVASIWVLTVREAGGEGGAMLIKNQHISKRGFPN